MNRAQMIAELRTKRTAERDKMQRVLDTAAKFNRTKLSGGEKERFDTAEQTIRAYDERIDELVAQQDTDDASAEYSRKYAFAGYGEGVTGEPEVYRAAPDSPSYFRDLYRARRQGDAGAMERLRRNDKMVADAVEKRARTGDRKAQTRALSTTNGAGGEWVPPLWLEDAWVRVVRPGRVTANLATPNPMPPGTDMINLPKMLTGTAVAVQATQGSGIQQTDATTGSIASPVITLAGGQTVAMQLVEQSPLNIDELLLGDLAEDYAQKADVQVLSGSGSSGQAMGLLNLAGTNSIAWTTSTPAVGGDGGLYAMLGAAVSAIHTNRLMPPDCIVMHPRRWAWVESRSDSSNRPLVLPDAQNPMNSAGIVGPLAAEGRVGTMMGLPVFTDANLPTNVGTGTNQDVILVTRASDLYVWESSLRAEAFEQTYASTLQLLCRVYSYLSFQPGRYPKSTAIISGTGLVLPVF